MYRRPILCTLYSAVDFLNVLKKGCGGGGLLVHNEIHYVPIGDGWEEVQVHNVLHYVPITPPLPPTGFPLLMPFESLTSTQWATHKRV